MAINSIYIQDISGNPVGELQERAGITNQKDTRMGVSPVGNNTVLLDSPYYDDIYAQALEELLNSSFVTTLNGIAPFSDGNFFINGSECVSWYKDLQEALVLLDLCPTCTNCDEVVILKKKTEYYKIVFNAIKNANLGYTTDSQALNEARIAIPENCAEALQEEYIENFEIKGLALLGQYATAVHMWNYVASQNNASSEIVNAPEDQAGFFIQTKRAFPSCSGTSSIQCVIDISLVMGQSGLSVYVHTPKTDFMPFKDNTAVTKHMATVDHTGVTTKVITTNFAPSTYAGTYSLQVKVLPFIYSELLDSNGDIINVRDHIDEGGERIEKWSATYRTEQVLAPSETDYNEAKLYPSKSSKIRNTWQITIRWILSGALDKEYVNTYYYECNGVREYMAGILTGPVPDGA